MEKSFIGSHFSTVVLIVTEISNFNVPFIDKTGAVV